jgi:cobalt-zinc-cadmium efflux system protein
MAAQAGVAEIHDLHVWEVTSGFPALSAAVPVGERNDCHEISYPLKRLLHAELEIDHTILQVDHEQTQLLTIETEEQRRLATRSKSDAPRRARETPGRSPPARGPVDAGRPFRQP